MAILELKLDDTFHLFLSTYFFLPRDGFLRACAWFCTTRAGRCAVIWIFFLSLLKVLDGEGEGVHGVFEALLVAVGVAVGVSEQLFVVVAETLSVAVGVTVAVGEGLELDEGVLLAVLGVAKGVIVGALVVDGHGSVH